MSSLSLSLSLLPSKLRQSHSSQQKTQHSSQQIRLKIAASSGSLEGASYRAPAALLVG